MTIPILNYWLSPFVMEIRINCDAGKEMQFEMVKEFILFFISFEKTRRNLKILHWKFNYLYILLLCVYLFSLNYAN